MVRGGSCGGQQRGQRGTLRRDERARASRPANQRGVQNRCISRCMRTPQLQALFVHARQIVRSTKISSTSPFFPGPPRRSLHGSPCAMSTVQLPGFCANTGQRGFVSAPVLRFQTLGCFRQQVVASLLSITVVRTALSLSSAVFRWVRWCGAQWTIPGELFHAQ